MEELDDDIIQLGIDAQQQALSSIRPLQQRQRMKKIKLSKKCVILGDFKKTVLNNLTIAMHQ